MSQSCKEAAFHLHTGKSCTDRIRVGSRRLRCRIRCWLYKALKGKVKYEVLLRLNCSHYFDTPVLFTAILIIFENFLPALLAICSHCILSICNIYLFPALVLRAGFAF